MTVPTVLCKHLPWPLWKSAVTVLVLLAAPVVSSADLEEVVVVGSRAAVPRSVEDSSVPVDIISREDFEDQGGSDMSNLIRALVPSFHVNDNPSRGPGGPATPGQPARAGAGSHPRADEQ